jgi:hypothetical protein
VSLAVQIKRRVVRPVRVRHDHRNTDVYVVSYPKSGRTWLRVMLGKAISDRYGLPEDQLLDTYQLTRRAGVKRTRFTHDNGGIIAGARYDELSPSKRQYRDKDVVLLVRDVKDTLVSCYFHSQKRLKRFEGTISDFIRDDRYGARKIVTFLELWAANQSTPRSFQVIRYEDMHRDPRSVLAAALAVLGVDGVDEALSRSAVEYASFPRMREMERKRVFTSDIMQPGDDGDDESFKVRRGVVHGYVDYLSDEDIRFVDGVIAEMGDPFGSEGSLAGREML